ncbi:hypothetical protein EIP86_004985 [Pleurotus ostreatoroseus]|nr:hypothetical protein EIP86_004985 [Pleurotus ostreatoroseus]
MPRSNTIHTVGSHVMRQDQSSKKDKSPRSIPDVLRIMTFSYEVEVPRLVHYCDGNETVRCPKGGQMHYCGFKGCNHKTNNKSNLSTHQLSQHVPEELWPQCPHCTFRWADTSVYYNHKVDKHGYVPEPRQKRDPNTFARKNKQSRRAEHRVNDGVYNLSKRPRSKYSTSRHRSPASSDTSDISLSSADTFSSLSSTPHYFSPSLDVFGGYFPVAPAVTLPTGINEHFPQLPMSPHNTFSSSSISTYFQSTPSASLAQWPSNDTAQNSHGYVWQQTGSSPSYSYGGSESPQYSSSDMVPASSWGSDLSSIGYAQTSDNSVGSDFDWLALEELLSAPLTKTSLDPALETTVQLGYLGNPSYTPNVEYSSAEQAMQIPCPQPSHPLLFDNYLGF